MQFPPEMIKVSQLVEDLETCSLDIQTDVLMNTLIYEAEDPHCDLLMFHADVIDNFKDRISGYLEQHQSELRLAVSQLISCLPRDFRCMNICDLIDHG